MAKSSGEIEREFMETLNAKTGKNLKTWLLELQNSNVVKRNDLVKWLKDKYQFKHTEAILLVGIFLNGGKPVYTSEEDLLENQLAKYDIWRPLFNTVSEKILRKFPDAKMIPKKTYVSFTANREFGAINIKASEIRLGMDLGSVPFSAKIEKAKLTGPMPRISHMVVLKENKDFDDNIITYLTESYNRVNL